MAEAAALRVKKWAGQEIAIYQQMLKISDVQL